MAAWGGGGRVGGPVAADLVRDGGVVGAVPHGAAASGPRFTITWIFVMCKRGGVGGGGRRGGVGLVATSRLRSRSDPGT